MNSPPDRPYTHATCSDAANPCLRPGDSRAAGKASQRENEDALKITIEITATLFRRARLAAARRGIPLRALVSEALADKLNPVRGPDKPWRSTFGGLRGLRKETARINRILEREFGQLEPEPWK
jgi:hypothetical protein